MEQKIKYWYEYRLRGLSLGCQPKGFVDSDEDWGKFGAIAYDRPLTEQELVDYELTPINSKTDESSTGGMQMLDFNQDLTIICVEEENTNELMTVEKWTKEQVIDFLEKIEGVGKLEVTQETDRGMTLSDGNIEFLIVEKQIVENARGENNE